MCLYGCEQSKMFLIKEEYRFRLGDTAFVFLRMVQFLIILDISFIVINLFLENCIFLNLRLYMLEEGGWEINVNHYFNWVDPTSVRSIWFCCSKYLPRRNIVEKLRAC